jgi:hypothetical protein
MGGGQGEKEIMSKYKRMVNEITVRQHAGKEHANKQINKWKSTISLFKPYHLMTRPRAAIDKTPRMSDDSHCPSKRMQRRAR